ncbi:MAG: amidophosphoribosyltransferase [Bacteroidales bacterium]|jgi:amidophosphoribosyltransferase|nr:amidophosphoribosyltransferase [Lentimicrobiaceae bacterium]MBT4764534.1 amidophosphoribosyltransferase [bacterium]MDG1135317.1 amidophosphoribosyltransferase [Bacteroidales bacterium]MDG1902595.1 amidophosphoribosyltransferase [Bacteroidales bacterium]MDG2081804.1 amidophosphoribosyltransferase [Bacteroidales bacterium]|tara:strand:+ start:16082 stop:17983 length:1902 start_codon:yes stop_codon:yes gene_type:complete
MSDSINHECGIALIRLRKPLEYYLSKYGTSVYGLQKLHLLMQKQHNRGQDGAGIAEVKFDLEPGKKYISRIRSNKPTPIKDLFNRAYDNIHKRTEGNPQRLSDVNWLKENVEFTGELFLGHLRYGTFGGNNISHLHPLVRANNWKTRNLVLAGNFNMTNTSELFKQLVDLGQYPVETSDTITVLEKIGHFLDEENQKLYSEYKQKGLSKKEITNHIVENIDLQTILSDSAKRWDGGYVIGGLVGHGDAFIMRDPNGIRPAFYYADDEVIVAASERPVIQTAFDTRFNEIKEIPPGHALIIKKDGSLNTSRFIEQKPLKACSFERIYFSRGTDKDIYKERKALGSLLTPKILEEINYDLKNTVFSYIPNTASVAFQGMMDQIHLFSTEMIKEKILKHKDDISADMLDSFFKSNPRTESIAVKDAKLRTFITEDNQRNDLVGHVYDVTYGIVKNGVDTLVVLDDSIVRGTTLKQSIIQILDRLHPKKIIIASSAPQIRYPDCYGIDMAKLSDFVAFNAAIELLKDTKQDHIINDVYNKSKAQEKLPMEEITNFVKDIYKPFTASQISEKVGQLVKAKGVEADVKVIYQSIENLHIAIPNHTGDWYFTGNYPTPGGNKVVNQSFINYIEGINSRAY